MNDSGMPDLSPAVGWRSRGYLPHFDGALVQQSITWHLADSLPTAAAAAALAGATDRETRQRYEDYLDAGHGSCVLREPACAAVVVEALQHFAGERYDLHAYAVMPNHVHVLIALHPGHDLPTIVHSWKRHSSAAINRFLGTDGPVWRREYWDRFIRDEAHWLAATRYIEDNPVKAGLVSERHLWPWSSAHRP
jgi:REP element-mobilizing transposase RayT